MGVMHRRSFLSEMTSQLIERVSSHSPTWLKSKNLNQDPWVSIGSLKDFPPGHDEFIFWDLPKSQSLNHGSKIEVRMISNRQGLKLLDLERNISIPLKLDRGQIFANFFSAWEKDAGISVLTGEQILV